VLWILNVGNICVVNVVKTDVFLLLEQERQCTFYVTLRHVRVNYALKSNRYYEYVCVCKRVCAHAFACLGVWARCWGCVCVVLVIQHPKFMNHIVTSFVVHPSPPHFSTLSHKRHDLKKKKKLIIKRVFRFLLQLCLKIFHSKKNILRYCHKCENLFM
jgi:hypothetical protein